MTNAEFTRHDTIQSGFTAVRRIRGQEFQALCLDLSEIALAQDIEVHQPWPRSREEKRPQLNLVRAAQVRAQNSHVLSLDRRLVYAELEKRIPHFSEKMHVECGNITWRDSKTPNSPKVLMMGFDERTTEQLIKQRKSVGMVVAYLAGVSLKELSWPKDTLVPSLPLAFAPIGTPDCILEDMKLMVENKDLPDLLLEETTLLPRPV